MRGEDLVEKLKDAPDGVKNCAMIDKVFYEKGGCTLSGIYKCPFQSEQYSVTVDEQKLPACERYHPKLQKG